MNRPFAPIVNGVYMTSAGEMSHFRIEEMICKCGCGSFQVDQLLIDVLELIREAAKAPIHVNSGVRCVKRNQAVGGKTRSQHLPRTRLTGEIIGESGTQDGATRAADITVRTLSPKALQNLVRNHRAEFGVHGLGCYPGLTHVDTRAGAYAEWKG